MMDKNQLTGRVLEIQRMSTEDGPGIRTTVFLKGCTLKCKWCHNPESISLKPELQWIAARCIDCKLCLSACPNKALMSSINGIVIDREKCEACGICVNECPSTALEILGKDWTVDDLFTELIKDRAYFDNSAGGITISGGEPSIHTDFVLALLKKLKNLGIHTALDTCGMTRTNFLERLLPYTDLILYDIKVHDNKLHKKFTKKSNKRILENLLYIKDFIKNSVHPPALWIRTPLIPQETDTKENILGIAKFISENIKAVVSKWELLAFNNLCEDKYNRLTKIWDYKNANLISKNHINDLVGIATKQGISSDVVSWSGSLKLEEEKIIETEKLILLK